MILWHGFDIAQKIYETLVRFAQQDTVSVASSDGLELLRAATRVAGWDVERAIEIVEPITDEAPTAVLTRLKRAVDEVRQKRHATGLALFPDGFVPGIDDLGTH